MCVERKLRKYYFLDSFIIKFQQKGENAIKMYIQNKLVDKNKECYLELFYHA